MWQISTEKSTDLLENWWQPTTTTKTVTKGKNKGKYRLYWKANQGGLWVLEV